MANRKFKMMALGAATMAAAGMAATPAQAQWRGGASAEEVIIGTIIRGVLGAGNYGSYPYGNYGYDRGYDRYDRDYRYGRYGLSDRELVDRCASAVEQRLNRYANYDRYDRRYDRYDRRDRRYDNRYYDRGNHYGQARVAGITDVDRTRYGLSVDGVAMSGRYAAQYNRYDRRGYGYNQRPDIKFDCDIERNGRIRDLDIDRR